MVIQLETPLRMIIAGSSGVGKSHFTAQLILNRHRLFKRAIDGVVYCAKFRTSIPTSLQALEQAGFLVFHEGTPTDEMLQNATGENKLFIIDDLLETAMRSEVVSDMMTQGRNRNISIILLVQNLFPQLPKARTISLQCNYAVIFRCLRDSSAIMPFAKQAFTYNARAFVDMYIKYINRPFAYLFCDFTQFTPNALRYRTDIFSPISTVFIHDAQLETLGKSAEQVSGYTIKVPET